MVKNYKNIDSAFQERVEEIESIFSSFRTLHALYAGVMKTANVNTNARAAFERAEKSAVEQQEHISQSLYGQGFTLLTGVAEALVKDVFENLVIENFAKLQGANRINFSVGETQDILMMSEVFSDSYEELSKAFGRLARNKLYKNAQNPTEKINFQNAETMVSTFKRYLGMELDIPDTIKSIHRHWQVRHCIVHTNSVIDKRFLNNVGQVGLLKQDEELGARLRVTKRDYETAKQDFVTLFDQLTKLISQHKLRSRFVSEED